MIHPKLGKLEIQKKKCAAKNLGNQKQTFCLSGANEALVRDGDLRSTRKLAESDDASIAKLTYQRQIDIIQPRAKKRRPKNRPLLTVPRKVARDIIYAQQLFIRVPCPPDPKMLGLENLS